jgi:hypothetical protein
MSLGGFRNNCINRMFAIVLVSCLATYVDASTAKVPVAPKSQAVSLGSNEQLAHPVVTGSLGPWTRTQVWLTQSADALDAPFSGKVVVDFGGKGEAVYALSPPYPPDGPFLMTVRSVMFRSIEKSSEKALIVLYAVTKIGPQQPVEYETAVYRWNGKEFSRANDTEERLQGARTSRDVDRKLARKLPGKSK